jgi:hypothetical protein
MVQSPIYIYIYILSRRPHLNGRAGALAGIAFYIIIINGDAIYSSLATRVQTEQSFSRAMFSSPSTLFRVLLTKSSGKPISTSFCTCGRINEG